ncbi:IMV membrane protein [Sea otter poxvirus]|uniref:IMV membrane protein n=1 Tax=Sea otter poxvirus TaxID=1416741 RepID=A0A2U9QHM9_9POXV|nr:IMV membrane protein [Sea otter poxvirus]AWU47110.1 IMV membrane protein [Sea otter poxvirus]
MNHSQYVFSMFLADDNAFFAYLTSQSDSDAMDVILDVTKHLTYILQLLIKSKDKLEAIGHCFEPLTENFRSLIHFKNMRQLRRVFDRTPLDVSSEQVRIKSDQITDFVVALMRLEKYMPLPELPNIVEVDMSQDIFLKNILEILSDDSNDETKN